MDFDEYEYLEKTVENPEHQKVKKDDGNGRVDNVKSDERNRSRISKHKRGERAYDSDDDHSHSKRSKSRDEPLHDIDRRKEQGSSCHRSRSRDGEKDRHRSSREHRVKDRDKEESNGRDKEKEHERDRKERDRERDREIERSSRSRNRPESEREKSQDHEFRERKKEREPTERDRESRFWELADVLEQCSDGLSGNWASHWKIVLWSQGVMLTLCSSLQDHGTRISLKANERDVYEFFSRAGKVRDVRLIMDRNSRRSKGVGYVEFYDVMSVPMAIALSGQPLLGQPVMVKPSEAEKNLVQPTTSVAAGHTGQFAAGGRRLYVGNLHFNITEEQLRQVFEPFGTVELVQLPPDETGHCKGFGFVQFARLEDAKNALNLNGQLEIGGRVIKVSTVTDQGPLQDAGTNAADLDDDEGGLSLNSSSRALLMAKLDRSGTASSITGSIGMPFNSTSHSATTAPILGAAPLAQSLVPATLQASIPTISGLPGGLQIPTNGIPIIDTIGVPSECLLLKNMFDPSLETEPDFDLDIKEDVKEECSKFGKLKHIHVDRDSAGFVYLQFEDMQGAINAQRNLHGRWFAGKMITATYMVPQTYEAKFPDSNK
ncbi:RNA-binding protein 39-like isoform X4 [Hibiscus syriacus]|uniref:RNA-binding protein 39-like isoform X4 n=1 Tax=Hibiscus syriacus TaxID=106335 RepID=A0A6A2XJC2_HIBSY|nr:RNA-binding protein 39-like isoform X4 [Hibiscus syriacus]